MFKFLVGSELCIRYRPNVEIPEINPDNVFIPKDFSDRKDSSEDITSNSPKDPQQH